MLRCNHHNSPLPLIAKGLVMTIISKIIDCLHGVSKEISKYLIAKRLPFETAGILIQVASNNLSDDHLPGGVAEKW